MSWSRYEVAEHAGVKLFDLKAIEEAFLSETEWSTCESEEGAEAFEMYVDANFEALARDVFVKKTDYADYLNAEENGEREAARQAAENESVERFYQRRDL